MKINYRSHTWYNESTRVSLCERRRPESEDGSTYVFAMVSTGGPATYHDIYDASWDKALTDLPQMLAEFGVTPEFVACPAMRKAYQIDVGDGVEQGLKYDYLCPGEVKWSLQRLGPQENIISGTSPTWDEAINHSLRVLPQFKALLKTAEEGVSK